MFYAKNIKRLIISERVNITRRFAKCSLIAQHVLEYSEEVTAKLSETIAYTDVPLDCRFSRIRTEETQLGNFVADIIRTETDADFAVVNGGCLRANIVYPSGPLLLRFMDQVIPGVDTIVRLRLSGHLILDMLENGVSKYPQYEGRFLQVSGFKFKFDPN